MQVFLTAAQVSEMLQCSTSMAYRIMRRLNQELEADGYITIGGRISRDYLCERLNIEDQHEKKEGVNSGKTKDV